IIVRIIDAETEEVVKEIPPEEILDLIAKLWEMAGIVVDERR
ncbi:MAG: flagellar protein FlaG, partial [Eubacteriales bacterium]|nr:flagellar protein FlaG [Eubacteriales bacterium]